MLFTLICFIFCIEYVMFKDNLVHCKTSYIAKISWHSEFFQKWVFYLVVKMNNIVWNETFLTDVNNETLPSVNCFDLLSSLKINFIRFIDLSWLSSTSVILAKAGCIQLKRIVLKFTWRSCKMKTYVSSYDE